MGAYRDDKGKVRTPGLMEQRGGGPTREIEVCVSRFPSNHHINHRQPYVLEAVRRAEKKILEAKLNHEYAGIQGTQMHMRAQTDTGTPIAAFSLSHTHILPSPQQRPRRQASTTT